MASSGSTFDENYESIVFLELPDDVYHMPKASKRKKNQSDDFNSIINAIKNLNETPPMNANHAFYASIAARAEDLSQRYR